MHAAVPSALRQGICGTCPCRCHRGRSWKPECYPSGDEPAPDHGFRPCRPPLHAAFSHHAHMGLHRMRVMDRCIGGTGGHRPAAEQRRPLRLDPPGLRAGLHRCRGRRLPPCLAGPHRADPGLCREPTQPSSPPVAMPAAASPDGLVVATERSITWHEEHAPDSPHRPSPASRARPAARTAESHHPAASLRGSSRSPQHPPAPLHPPAGRAEVAPRRRRHRRHRGRPARTAPAWGAGWFATRHPTATAS